LTETGWTEAQGLAGTTGKHGVEFYAAATRKNLKRNGKAEQEVCEDERKRHL